MDLSVQSLFNFCKFKSDIPFDESLVFKHYPLEPTIDSVDVEADDVNKPRYSRIRVKEITYLQRPCFAIGLQDVTDYMETLKLQTQVLEERGRAQSLENFTSTISHEFRAPLGTSLMFLENLLESGMLTAEQRSTINLLVCQLNLLLCLVNDVLDIKLIESGKFRQKSTVFDPRETIEFIKQIFLPQSEMQGVQVET